MSVAPTTLLTRLGLLGVIFFGLAYMAPGVVTSTFGVVSQASHGVAPTAYLVATLAMSLTAVSYATLSRAFPTSGSSYSYVGNVLGRPLGFFAGWLILLDYLFLPMVAWLIQSIYLNAQFPAIPIWVWLLINVGLTTAINLLGISLASRVNTWLTVVAMATVAAMTLVIAVAVFSIADVDLGARAGDAIWNSDTSLTAIGTAAAVAAYSFLGFDAVSTLSEETRNPRRNIPVGIVAVVLIGGVIFVGVSFVMQLMHPGGQFDDPDIAGYTMSVAAGGQVFADVTNLLSIVAGFGSGIAIQATSSRLLFVIGRDGALPGTIFGRLSRTFRVPWVNILIIAAIGIMGSGLDLERATSLINFGAFLSFALVNIACLRFLWRRRSEVPRWLTAVLATAAVGGILTDLYLFSQLHETAFMFGAGWLVLGVGVLAWVTRGFRRPIPSISDGA